MSELSLAEQLWLDPDWTCPRCGWVNMAIREICRNFDCCFDSALVSGDAYFGKPIRGESPATTATADGGQGA